MGEEYKKSCHDELNWVEIEQLHTATVEISKNCFEYKKLCIGLLGVGAALIIKFSSEPLAHLNFSIAMLVCFGFWLADSTAYYYQRSIRKAMANKMFAVASRNQISDYEYKEISLSILGALFNGSMILYYALLILICGGWLVYSYSIQ